MKPKPIAVDGARPWKNRCATGDTGRETLPGTGVLKVVVGVLCAAQLVTLAMIGAAYTGLTLQERRHNSLARAIDDIAVRLVEAEMLMEDCGIKPPPSQAEWMEEGRRIFGREPLTFNSGLEEDEYFRQWWGVSITGIQARLDPKLIRMRLSNDPPPHFTRNER